LPDAIRLSSSDMRLTSLVPVLLTSIHALSANAQIVVAHFMAQNAFSYSQADWTNDINTAKATGIDGFGELHPVQIAFRIERENSIECRFAGLRGRSRCHCICR
jgi:hypothetical protein